MDRGVPLLPSAHTAERALSVSALQKLGGHKCVLCPLCSSQQGISELIETEFTSCERGPPSPPHVTVLSPEWSVARPEHRCVEEPVTSSTLVNANTEAHPAVGERLESVRRQCHFAPTSCPVKCCQQDRKLGYIPQMEPQRVVKTKPVLTLPNSIQN